MPEDAKTEELTDLIEWLGELVRQVDSSLLDEWERLQQPDAVDGRDAERARRAAAARSPPTCARSGCWSATRCSAGSSWPRCAAGDELGELDARGRLGRRRAGPTRSSRTSTSTTRSAPGPTPAGPALLIIDGGAGERWAVRQILDDPAGDHDWGISAEVDLAASDAAGAAVVRVTDVGPL